jgi:hypothetical protein
MTVTGEEFLGRRVFDEDVHERQSTMSTRNTSYSRVIAYPG